MLIPSIVTTWGFAGILVMLTLWDWTRGGSPEIYGKDDHIMPFQGTIDWRKILPVLSEINYEGDLTFEIHCSTSRLPDNLLDDTALLAEKVGRYLLNLATGKAEN